MYLTYSVLMTSTTPSLCILPTNHLTYSLPITLTRRSGRELVEAIVHSVRRVRLPPSSVDSSSRVHAEQARHRPHLG